MDNERTQQLKKIRDEIWNLTSSPLYSYRTQNKYFPVLGEGNHNPEVVFVGEAPGRNEAETGRPFCGAAGKVLDKLLQAYQIQRSDVYITNIVKDRPPENRDPTPEEIALYSPYLMRQLAILKPKIIATLGRYSMEFIMLQFGLSNELQSISKIHGKVFAAKTSWGDVFISPLYHPAVATYNPKLFETMKKDFAVVLDSLKQARSPKQESLIS